MNSSILRGPVDLDPLRAAAGLAATPGTLLLHGQRGEGGPMRSALLFEPRWVLRQELGAPPHWSGDVPSAAPPPLSAERAIMELSAAWKLRPGSEPVFVGLAGYLGYDLGPQRWGARAAASPPFQTPAAWIGAFDTALLFGPEGTAELLVADLSPLVPIREPLEARWQRAYDRLRSAGDATRAPQAHRRVEPALPDRRWHHDAVQQIQRHLRAGDVYQVNLTSFATARCTLDPWDVFLDQARRNPVALAAYLNTGSACVSSHSPERLLRLRGETAVTSPIKGTTPEGHDDERRLRTSEKDRAEHVMIVDLCRNDLGIHARYGSVRVRELMTPLRLSRLVHLVSHIEARIPAAGRAHVLADLFPGGSITGAPKRRAMEIIAQRERFERGPYTGSVGYVDRTGNSDWNIAIRTAVWQGDSVSFGCGGGIVLDSDPDCEYEEAVLKARSFFDTLHSLCTLHAAPARGS